METTLWPCQPSIKQRVLAAACAPCMARGEGHYRVAWIEYIFCCYTASLYLSTRLGSLKCMRPERITYGTRPQHPYATQPSLVDVRENLLEIPARSRLSLYERLLGLPIFGTPRPCVTIDLERLGGDSVSGTRVRRLFDAQSANLPSIVRIWRARWRSRTAGLWSRTE